MSVSGLIKRDKRCRLCMHTDIQKIHALWLSPDRPKRSEIARLYLPESEEKSAYRCIKNHFEKHVNLEKVVDHVISEAERVIVGASSNELADYDAFPERAVFTRAAAERISSNLTLEILIRSMMEKINIIEDEFQCSTQIDKCPTCKRMSNGPALMKQLACVRELRELNKELQNQRDPVSLFRQSWGSTFVRFVNELTTAYADILRDRNNLIHEAVNSHIRGEIGQPVLLRRIQDAEDLGAPLLAEKSNLISQMIMKEFSRVLDQMTPGKKASGKDSNALTPIKTLD